MGYLLTNDNNLNLPNEWVMPGGGDEPNNFITFEDEGKFFQACINEVSKVSNKFQDEFNIGLCGGSVSKLYSRLSEERKKIFKDVNFWQVDERFVSKDDENSNYLLIQENLLKPLGKNGYKSFHYFDTDLPEADEILNKYESELRNIPNGKFDLVILGVGPDGHIASIFPNSNAINEENKPVAHTTTERFEVKDRFTITYPMIMNSDEIMVVMIGKSKKEVFEKLKSNTLSPEAFPAQKLMEHSNLKIFWGNF